MRGTRKISRSPQVRTTASARLDDAMLGAPPALAPRTSMSSSRRTRSRVLACLFTLRSQARATLDWRLISVTGLGTHRAAFKLGSERGSLEDARVHSAPRQDLGGGWLQMGEAGKLAIRGGTPVR